jgi:hypothetical protein
MKTTMGKGTTCKVAYSRKTTATKALSTELPLNRWEAALHNRNSRTGPFLDPVVRCMHDSRGAGCKCVLSSQSLILILGCMRPVHASLN